jgi:hypothetical protein
MSLGMIKDFDAADAPDSPTQSTSASLTVLEGLEGPPRRMAFLGMADGVFHGK